MNDLATVSADRDEAYHERNRLVCALSKLWPAHLARHPDDDLSWDDQWRWIVCVHSPVGQLTWHIHDRERQWFDHLPVRSDDWDGHSTAQKYERLERLKVDEPVYGDR